MSRPDIRWQQRLQQFDKALQQLAEAVALAAQRPLSKLERQGLIKAFEFTHELAWNVLKDFFEFQGATSIMGSRDATRMAFERGLVADGEGWMAMIRSRNQTAHTYNEEVAREIEEVVCRVYLPLFAALRSRLQGLVDAG